MEAFTSTLELYSSGRLRSRRMTLSKRKRRNHLRSGNKMLWVLSFLNSAFNKVWFCWLTKCDCRRRGQWVDIIFCYLKEAQRLKLCVDLLTPSKAENIKIVVQHRGHKDLQCTLDKSGSRWFIIYPACSSYCKQHRVIPLMEGYSD